MKKFFLTALFSVFFFMVSATVIFGQNKAGINIGDRWGEFDQAAGIVGNGGWVVIMACPGDGDKIADVIVKHREINLIIRGHYPGNTPNASLAKAWAATLGAIPSPNKIYFMPWNEPNQTGSPDYGDPAVISQYISDLKVALGSLLNSKVILLSPMMNPSNPSFSGYVQSLGSGFFSQFNGIALSLYDTCNGCGNKYQDPQNLAALLSEMGASGKQIYGVESGTAGQYFYFNQPPDQNSYLYKFVNSFLSHSPNEVAMFAIPSYDLAGEKGHSWSLYNPSNVIGLLSSFPNGPNTPASSATVPNVGLTKCPGKNYTFYQTSETECAECGGGFSALSCLPIQGNQFGEEYSKNTLPIQEKVRNTYDESCNVANFTAKTTVSDMTIPFAYELNQYFLGPYMDSLGARVGKQNLNPMTDFGGFEKLAPKEYQDQLRLKFLDEVVSRGGNSKYANFNINGMGPAQIAGKFRNSPDKSFLTVIWPQVPLFANEETEGEIVLEGPGISGSVKTSVPEVYRLNKVTTEIAKMMGTYKGEVQGIKTESAKVLAACATEPNFQNISNKKTKTGTGSNVCTKEEIQTNPKTNLTGERHYDQEVFQTGDAGGCDGKAFNACCGSGGKCEPVDSNDISNQCVKGTCICHTCDQSWMTCWANRTNQPGCKIKEAEHTFNVDVSVKNRVPFLKQIAENTIGEKGFLRTFLPFFKNKTGVTKENLERQFKEVAGESTANLKIDEIKKVNNQIDVSPASGPISLLFHKLGTLVNVQKFISGVVLWPWGKNNPNPSPSPSPVPSSVGYVIDYRNSNIDSEKNRTQVIALVKAWYASSKIDQNWNYIRDQAISHSWNPAFVLALWIEESAASGADAYDLGCLLGPKNNIVTQLDCLFQINYAHEKFEDFMCMYSEGQMSPCFFALNPQFTTNLKIWYDRIVQ